MILQAYFDGNAVRPIQDYKFEKGEKITLIVADKDGDHDDAIQEAEYAPKSEIVRTLSAIADETPEAHKSSEKWTRDELYRY